MMVGTLLLVGLALAVFGLWLAYHIWVGIIWPILDGVGVFLYMVGSAIYDAIKARREARAAAQAEANRRYSLLDVAVELEEAWPADEDPIEDEPAERTVRIVYRGGRRWRRA